METMTIIPRDGGPKALKILTNDVTALQGKEAFELEVLKNIASPQSRLSPKRLLQLFDIPGEHGDHLCLVTVPLGPSLLEVCLKFESKCLPLQLVKRITRQLLEALNGLHDQCQTVHTGKLNSNTISFRTTVRLQKTCWLLIGCVKRCRLFT
jgi:serine/threonine-protein kinase SRPK3